MQTAPLIEPVGTSVTAPASALRAAAPALTELEVLDDAVEWMAFSHTSPANPKWLESSVWIDGITCAACATKIEQALCATPGVIRADVSAAAHRATVVWAPDHVKPSGWMQAVRRAGYRALPGYDQAAVELRRRAARLALWRTLVAGLCMMQVMMYAYPAYVAVPGDLSAEMEQLLRWASWLLALPVLLFSCGPFFRGAARDLARGRIGMEFPVALGMLVTFAVSSAGTFDPGGVFGQEVYFDSFTMFVFFLLAGRWLELRLRDRTAGALEALANRLPATVQRLLADGTVELVALRRLRVGDTLRVRAGEAFGADGLILQGQTQVDQSLLTGESHPLQRQAGDTVIGGSYNLLANVDVLVQGVGADTRFACIVDLMHSAASSRPRLAALADRLAGPFLVGVLLAAAAACAYWWPINPGHAVMVAVAVLIVTCPCALALATPTAMLASAGALARQGVLVRRLQALEALAEVDTVVFDKTGTLTTDQMRVSAVTVRPGADPQVAMAMGAAIAEQSLHPLARAITRDAACLASASAYRTSMAREVVGQGVCAEVAPIDGSAAASPLRLGSATFCAVPPGLSGSAQVFLSDVHGWLASYCVVQELRPEAASVVAQLQRSGLEVVMLSGDETAAAQAVAESLGITRVYSLCSPEQKLDRLRSLQADGRRVAMVGDGINDAPVLAAAEVAFAFGQAVPLAQSYADFVILGGQLPLVAQALERSRSTMRVVRQNLAWALAYNLSCIPLAAAGWLPAWLAGLGMAGSSLLVVLNAMRLAQPLAAFDRNR